MSQLKQIITYSEKLWASDIHIWEDSFVSLRVNWEIVKLEKAWKTQKPLVKEILLDLMNRDESVFSKFIENKDLDFAYSWDDKAYFRVNSFFKMGKVAIVMRRIESKVKTIEELWLPDWVKKFTKAKWGLILITGPTGSWKSTSMVSILDEINKTRKEHILTIEDPIEFIFEDNQSIFSQRQIWKDSKDFASALKSAMREDPDIVVVWEMRDKETVEAAMELAETWHLVISTLHTASSVQTVSRLVNFFHPDIQNSVRYKLADILFWVMSQRLVKTANEKGRVWIFEIMMMTPWIKNLIRNWDFAQIANNIEMWSWDSMISMKNYADELASKSIIKEEDYINYFQDEI